MQVVVDPDGTVAVVLCEALEDEALLEVEETYPVTGEDGEEWVLLEEAVPG